MPPTFGGRSAASLWQRKRLSFARNLLGACRPSAGFGSDPLDPHADEPAVRARLRCRRDRITHADTLRLAAQRFARNLEGRQYA